MKRILVIEGQGGAPLVKNQLVLPVMNKNPGKINPTFISWRDWQAWRGYRFDIVIGHSLGGQSALDFAAQNPVKNVITIDPRRQSNWGIFDWFRLSRTPFKAPPATDVYNFFEDGFFHGYPVIGAESEQKLSWTTHLSICGRAEVADCFEKLLLE